MKKQIIVLFLALIYANLTEAQIPSPLINVYIVGTSTTDQTVNTGLVKRVVSPTEMSLPSDCYNSATLDYKWQSGDLRYILWFWFNDYNLTKIQERGMLRPELALKPIIIHRSYFDSIYPQAYDLDQIMQTDSTGNSISTWAMPLRGKRIYFIDRNDMTATEIKLIPAMIGMVHGSVHD